MKSEVFNMSNELQLKQPLPADQNPAAIYLARLSSEGSRRVMATALNNIAFIFGVSIHELNWPALRYQHTQYIRAQLIQQYAPSTVNRHLSALRGVIRESWRLGHIDAEIYRRTIDVTNITEEKLPTGRFVPQDELRTLLNTCQDDGVHGPRDLALIVLLCVTGMRRSEIVSLDYENFDLETGRIELIAAKGRKDRIVYIDERTIAILQQWIALRGTAPGPFFTSVDKNMARLTTNAVYMMLQRRIKRAGIEKLSPHDLRRTFVSNMLDGGVDISIVAKIAGHKNIQTTARYDRRGEDALKKAASAINIPFESEDEPK